MVQTIVSQVAAAPVAGAIPGFVGLMAFAYIMYKVIIVKDQAFIASMTGMKAILPLLILAALALIPAATFAFGVATPIMLAVLEIVTMGLVGYLSALAIVQFTAKVLPAYLPEGI